MTAKLRYVEIKKLFGQYDVEWNIDKDTTVLVGQNGSGKTTILNLLQAIFIGDSQHDDVQKTASLANSCRVHLSNKAIMVMHYQSRIGSDLIKSFIKQNLKKDRNVEEISEDDLEYLKLLEQLKHVNINHIMVEGNDRFSPNDFHFEFISTLNMSANATNNIKASDGKSLNILDIEIDQAITAFQKLKEQKNYFEIKEKLIRVLNDFFSTTQKTITLTDTDFKIENAINDELKLSQLSAGERQIIYIVFKVAKAYFNEALILMDEPEISLHLEWQEKLLKNLREINDKSQMIVVTHSPAIVMDGWMDSYVDIQTILKPMKDDE